MGQDGYRWQNGRVCGGHPVRVEVLDDLVWESVKQLMKEPEMMLKEYTNRTEEKSKWALNSDSMKDRKDRELRKAQHERERLIELYQQSLVTLEDIEPKLKQVRTRIVKIEAELHYLQQEKERQNRQLQLIESFESFVSELNLNLEELPFESKRKVIQLLVSQVFVDTRKEEIEIKHIMPLGAKSCLLRSGRKRTPLGNTLVCCSEEPIFQNPSI